MFYAAAIFLSKKDYTDIQRSVADKSMCRFNNGWKLSSFLFDYSTLEPKDSWICKKKMFAGHSYVIPPIKKFKDPKYLKGAESLAALLNQKA
jgi:hypothetical protein